MDQPNFSGDYDVLLDLVKSRASVRDSTTPLPMRSGRRLVPVLAGSVAIEGVKGRPLWTVKILPTSQFFTKCDIMPWRPFANGIA